MDTLIKITDTYFHSCQNSKGNNKHKSKPVVSNTLPEGRMQLTN
jgi:hypothetical protein